MSFPSATALLEQGQSPENALLGAMKQDTAAGWAYLCGLTRAFKARLENPLAHIKELVPEHAESVLRFEWLPAGGLKVDVDPDSTLGRQVTRLLGTDVARSLAARELDMHFALANCCGGVGGDKKEQVFFDAGQQIAWQNSIDC